MGFARRFFRELFECLPPQAVVVLDNYQEVPTSEAFHQIVAEAVAEVPEGNSLVVISRRDPPDSFARLAANGTVTVLDWDELRLTLEETRALAGPRIDDDKGVHRLHAQCGGWVAGLTLLLENSSFGEVSEIDPVNDLDMVFKYFAAQILDHLDADTQQFLMETSCLPRVSVETARALTCNDRAGRILDELYRRHLFLHRRPTTEVSYQYHALFRTFLLKRAEACISRDERHELMCRAGLLLEQSGQAEDAYALYANAAQWSYATALVLREAPALHAQGRARTLQEWICGLPTHVRGSEPWFDYWLGQASLVENQTRARALFERAADGFEQSGDMVALALATCGVIDSVYFEWSDFSPMSKCAERLKDFIGKGCVPERPEVELRVYSGLLVAILYGRPSHPALVACVEKVHRLLGNDLDVNLKVSSATFLMTYCALALDGRRGLAIRSDVAELLADSRVTPLNKLWWLVRDAWLSHRIEGKDRRALEQLNAADKLIEEKNLSGMRSATMLIASYRHAILVANRSWQQARIVRDSAARAANSERRIHEYNIVQMAILHALSIGNVEEAERLIPVAHESAFRSGMPYVRVQAKLLHATSRALAGDIQRTSEIFDCIAGMTNGTCFAWYLMEEKFLRAVALYRAGELHAALDMLHIAFHDARIADYSFPERSHADFGRLCGIALDAGIETAFIESLVRRFRLPAPDVSLQCWPWPVEIFSLGDFRVRCDGAPLEFSARAPKKVLGLLKALVALGGRNVSQAALIDALWSDEDGDAAANALGVTVSRLRKLLDCPDAILVVDEQLSLNVQCCWVDAFAFERLADKFPAAGDEAASQRFIGRVLELYRGPFLPAESGQRWTMQIRMRLRDRFIRFVERAGLRLEGAGDFKGAIDCYRRGLDADDLAEEFYQGLMRCYLALRRPAEGMQVFRRLRQTLSVLLGIAPSPQSESLAAALQERGRVHSGGAGSGFRLAPE